MHKSFIELDSALARSVPWQGDGIEYDCQLFQLGKTLNSKFVVTNPNIPLNSHEVLGLIPYIPNTKRCVVITNGGEWLAKFFPKYWNPSSLYLNIELELELEWIKNPAVPNDLTYTVNPKITYKPNIYDYGYELVWYMDTRFVPSSDRIWVIKARPKLLSTVKGVKDMGGLYPELDIEFNPKIPYLDVDLDSLYPPYYDLAHECAYQIDPIHTPYDRIWALRFKPKYSKPKPLIWQGYITPSFRIDYNPILPSAEYSIPWARIDWQDLWYEHVWYINSDRVRDKPEEKVWAVKVSSVNEPIGSKHVGTIEPKFEVRLEWERNKDVPDQLRFDQEPELNYSPHILEYPFELVWYVDDNHLPTGSRLWAYKARPVGVKTLGIKDMGTIKPIFDYIWEFNPAIDCNYKFNPQLQYPIQIFDLGYELIWNLDQRFNPDKDHPIWSVRALPSHGDIKGQKTMENLEPDLEVYFNPELPDLEIDLNPIFPPYFNIANQCAYQIDPKFTPFENTWAVKFQPRNREPKALIWLGYITPNFEITLNEDLHPANYLIPWSEIVWRNFAYEHVWFLDSRCYGRDRPEKDIWAVKVSAVRNPIGTKKMGEIAPVINYEFNTDLGDIGYDLDSIILYHDFAYEHVWMLDRQYHKEEFDIWAVKAKVSNDIIGYKDQGSVKPYIEIEYNKDLPDIEFEVDLVIPYQDLIYQHEWYLDSRFTKMNEKIWAFRTRVADPMGLKDMGEISPLFEKNPEIPDIDYEVLDFPSYYDFNYELVWYLNSQINPQEDKIWALRHHPKQQSLGVKDMGLAQVKILYNPDLPKVNFNFNNLPAYYDTDYQYDLTWYLDPKFTGTDERIWAAKIQPSFSTGVKDMGYIKPNLADKLDVIFISYHEPNAEANWQRVREKAPWAKRIDGVTGIFQAHRAAAEISNSDMFYVVDGDAWLVDDWQFDFQPIIFDRDCAFIWSSKNPINDLVYGYGGVKLFVKDIILNIPQWTTLDMTTTIFGKIKIVETISCESRFNTDEFSAWRSAFRECVKLQNNIKLDPNSSVDRARLARWINIGADRPFGKYAILGARQGMEFANSCDVEKQVVINDRIWLETMYKKSRE